MEPFEVLIDVNHSKRPLSVTQEDVLPKIEQHTGMLGEPCMATIATYYTYIAIYIAAFLA